ncbi:MAG: peptidylprolyl isomerase [Coriobacteriia bacterium]|nr:peptidylprolyl isomerase [Coriobacteriia bacterium]
MSNAGKKIKAHYTGTLDDGTKFDSSFDRDEPIEFVCMTGRMIPGFDAAVADMQPGETKKVHIPAEQAYGKHNPDKVVRVPTSQLPKIENAPVGVPMFLIGPNDEFIPVVILEKTPEIVVLDTNHELAGKDLNFEITLLEVLD